MINPCQHHAATLETDFMQLDWQLLEHWELMVEYQAHLPVGTLRQIPLSADHDNVLLGFILPRSRLESLQKFLPSQKVQGGCDIRRNHLQS